MVAVLCSQFLSALADNSLLFAAIALLKLHHAPDWQIPMLQEFFVIAFILLAPFVGPFADNHPKGRVMLIANTIKLFGATSLFLGLNPLLGYGIVGLGAAAYSPAKYGILSELVNKDKIVKANGMMEGSTIVAILLGAVIGGKLADISLTIALTAICMTYLLAACINLAIPKLPAFKKSAPVTLINHCKEFNGALSVLMLNGDARLSLIGTSTFWGAGSTLRLLMVAWVPAALGIADLSIPANLSGAVAIGISLGAVLAATYINLNNIDRVLPAGLGIGVLIILFAFSPNLYAAVTLLILIGAAGGFYVVPLNALLQERGVETVGAGHAVAVQNFVENCAMLILVGLYTLMQKNHIPVIQATIVFGSIVFLGIILLAAFRLNNARKKD